MRLAYPPAPDWTTVPKMNPMAATRNAQRRPSRSLTQLEPRAPAWNSGCGGEQKTKQARR